MLRVSMPTSPRSSTLKRDLGAEVHEVELLVQRDVVAAADGGNASAALGLPWTEIGRGEDDLVAHLPALGIQHLDRSGAGLGGDGQFGPGWCWWWNSCRFRVPPESMDSAVLPCRP